MTDIIRPASAGTMESSDAYVEITPAAGGIELSVESAVLAQFGDAIRACAQEVLDGCGVGNAKVRIVDQGALDCVIRARVETAVRRASEVK